MDDIVEITDWSRRSSAEILDVIEYHADVLRGVTLYYLAWIMEPAKALVARVEGMAVEAATLRAKCDELQAQLTEQQESCANLNHGLAVEVAHSYEEHLAALRSQLVVGGWRPVSEAPTETNTLVLMRSYTNQHGYEYKCAIWQNLYENVWKNTVSRRLEGYWFSVEEDEDELDIDEWNEWLPLPRWPVPTQE